GTWARSSPQRPDPPGSEEPSGPPLWPPCRNPCSRHLGRIPSLQTKPDTSPWLRLKPRASDRLGRYLLARPHTPSSCGTLRAARDALAGTASLRRAEAVNALRSPHPASGWSSAPGMTVHTPAPARDVRRLRAGIGASATRGCTRGRWFDVRR